MTRDEMQRKQLEQLKQMNQSMGGATYMTEVAMPGCAPKTVNKDELNKPVR